MAKPKELTKLRIIFEDIAFDSKAEDQVERFNGYKTLVFTVPAGIELSGYRVAGVEWIDGEE